MHNNLENRDDFQESVYAQELRRPGNGLRFSAGVESEYLFVHYQRVHQRVRIWSSVTVIAPLCLALIQLRRETSIGWQFLVLLTALAGSVFIVVTAWSNLYERWYLSTARVLLPIIYSLMAILVAFALARGLDEQLAALTLGLVAVFFFAGLMFREALFTATLMLIAFAIGAWIAQVPGFLMLKSSAILIVTMSICAIVYRDVERSYRRSFLEGALIRHLVTRDGLTGLMNRRAFDEHLQRAWQQALRDRRPLAVLMIDIDFFKRYNDEFGHQAGDLALRSVAKVLQELARRPMDLAARYGGEEFAVILYDLAMPQVFDIAERARETIQDFDSLPHETSSGAPCEVTVSIGVSAITPVLGRSAEGALQLADEALYDAKLSGRNRTVAKGDEEYRLLDTGAFRKRKTDV